jgi:hypothetical protein
MKASASADANVVVDKYGFDVNAKAGAEANLVKGEAGAEYRLTPKALFDNTIGWMTGTTAPDVLDIGPVIGAKVSAGEGVGGTVEAGGRLGVDEVNVRGGGFLELEEGVGLDFKAGMRLGPLRVAYDNKDAILKAAGEVEDEAAKEVSTVAGGVADTVRNVGSAVGGGVTAVASAAAGAAENVGSAVGRGASDVASATAGAVCNVGSAVSQGVSDVASAASSAASGVAGAVGGAAEGLANAASDTWNNLWS